MRLQKQELRPHSGSLAGHDDPSSVLAVLQVVAQERHLSEVQHASGFCFCQGKEKNFTDLKVSESMIDAVEREN